MYVKDAKSALYKNHMGPISVTDIFSPGDAKELGLNFSIAVVTLLGNSIIAPSRFDSTVEILEMVEGRITVWVNGVKFDLAPPQFLLIPPDCITRFENKTVETAKLFAYCGPAWSASDKVTFSPCSIEEEIAKRENITDTLLRQIDPSTVPLVSGSDDTMVREIVNHEMAEKLKLNFSLIMVKMNPEQSSLLHSIQATEMYWVRQGAVFLHVENEVQALPQGFLGIVPKNAQQKARTGDKVTDFMCICSPPWKKELQAVHQLIW